MSMDVDFVFPLSFLPDNISNKAGTGFVDMFLLDHYLVFCVVFFVLLVFVLCFVPNVASISR